MLTRYSISRRSQLQVWLIWSALFLLWLFLLITSGNSIESVIPDIVLLAVTCSFLPIMGTFFVYVTIDNEVMTVPRALCFRRTISIRDIRALRYRSSAIGLVKGITIEYVSEGGKQKKASLPSISTFGTKKTSQMIAGLSARNPSITIDPRINALLR